MHKKIVIIGAGGFGREVAWLIEDINKKTNEWEIAGFVDDDFSKHGKEINGYKVLGDVDWLALQSFYVVNAIGNPRKKQETIERLENSKNTYPVLVHPSVIMSERVSIGEGSIICAGNILTVNIELGRHVIINLDCTIGHDVVIGDYSTVLPSVNISGAVKIGECVDLGTGSAIIQGLSIANHTIIGAGGVVVKNIEEPGTYVGVPARKL